MSTIAWCGKLLQTHNAMLYRVPVVICRSSVRPAILALPMLLRSIKEKSLSWASNETCYVTMGMERFQYSKEPWQDVDVILAVQCLVKLEIELLVNSDGLLDVSIWFCRLLHAQRSHFLYLPMFQWYSTCISHTIWRLRQNDRKGNQNVPRWCRKQAWYRSMILPEMLV